MYFDRFDIVTAHYLFCCHYHGGQASRLYARLCRIGKYFTPSPLLSLESLNENEREIYDNLVARETEYHMRHMSK